MFADTHPPKGNNEWMTSKDELDFIDFTEAIGRNIPFRHTPKTPNFYCWMYAPEVRAVQWYIQMMVQQYSTALRPFWELHKSQARQHNASHRVWFEHGKGLLYLSSSAAVASGANSRPTWPLCRHHAPGERVT